MLNYNKLKDTIREKGLKYGFIAQEMGINPNTFSKKMDGSYDFKLTEVEKMTNLLGLNDTEVCEIFFADSVPETSTEA